MFRHICPECGFTEVNNVAIDDVCPKCEIGILETEDIDAMDEELYELGDIDG